MSVTTYPEPPMSGVLTPDQSAALLGSDGVPGAGNKYLTSEAIIVTAENKDSVIILKGQPLKIHPSGTGVQLASQSSVCRVFAGADTAVGAAVPVRAAGIITLSDWASITGSSSLTAGGVYYLSGTPGQLTATPPTSGFLQQVARALSLNSLRIAIEQSILL